MDGRSEFSGKCDHQHRAPRRPRRGPRGATAMTHGSAARVPVVGWMIFYKCVFSQVQTYVYRNTEF